MVLSLLRAWNVGYRPSDRLAYSEAQIELRKGIQQARNRYRQCIEEHFADNNPSKMWRGIRTITECKDSNQ